MESFKGIPTNFSLALVSDQVVRHCGVDASIDQLQISSHAFKSITPSSKPTCYFDFVTYAYDKPAAARDVAKPIAGEEAAGDPHMSLAEKL